MNEKINDINNAGQDPNEDFLPPIIEPWPTAEDVRIARESSPLPEVQLQKFVPRRNLIDGTYPWDDPALHRKAMGNEEKIEC